MFSDNLGKRKNQENTLKILGKLWFLQLSFLPKHIEFSDEKTLTLPRINRKIKFSFKIWQTAFRDQNCREKVKKRFLWNGPKTRLIHQHN